MSHLVLIIDDEPQVAEAVRVRLTAEGYEVIHADCGLTGLKMARTHSPHVILLDISMPGLDGFDVRRAIAADRELADIPVIYLTAHAIESAMRQPYDPGAILFLSKPFESRELLSAVERAVRRRSKAESGAH